MANLRRLGTRALCVSPGSRAVCIQFLASQYTPDLLSSAQRLPIMHQAFLDRLATPHESLAETSQRYSTFNSTHAQSTYEEQMVKASKICGRSSARWDAREPWERGWIALRQAEKAEGDAQAKVAHREQMVGYLYAYLEMELSTAEGRKPEAKMVQAVYERWLEVVGRDTRRDGRVAEAAVWDRYITYVVSPRVSYHLLHV